MADSKWGNMRPGRKDGSRFSKLVSPLGANGAETPAYTPSHEVTGAAPQGNGSASRSESSRNDRRGG